MAEESVVVFLRAQIGEFQGKMRTAGAEVESLGAKGESSFAKFQTVGTTALLAVGAAALAGGALAIKSALDYEAAHARLVTAIHNNGEAFDDYKGKIEDVAKQLQNLGFDDGDMESSLAKLTGVTHDTGKALDLMGLAADIARGRHIDLAAATDILVKVESGRVSMLGRLGIATKDSTGKTIDQETAIRRLTDLYGGNASAYADTFAGKIEVLKTKGLDLVEAIGLKLIPVVESLLSFILDGIGYFDRANDATGGWLAKISLIAIAAPLAAIAILKIAGGIGSMISAIGTGAAAIASFAESIALFAMLNPEIAILIGVAAGIGAVVAALHFWGGAHDSAKKDAKDFTAALEQDTEALGRNSDALGTNTEALVRKKLADENQIDDLARIEGSLHNGKSAWDTWTEAVNGSTDAAVQIRQAMLDAHEVTLEAIPGMGLSADEMDRLTQSWLENGGSIDENLQRLGLYNGTQRASLDGNVGLTRTLDDQTRARKTSKQALEDEIAAGVRNKDGTLAETDAKKKDAAATDESTGAKGRNTTASAAEIEATKAAAKAADDHRKALGDLRSTYGPLVATMIDKLHAGTDAEKAMAASGEALKTGIESSFTASTDIVAEFGNQAQVTSEQVMTWLFNQVTAAASWSTNLKQLADAGVNEGLLETLAKAGPKAAPLVAALLEKVKSGGVGAINALQTESDRIMKQTETDILNHKAGVYGNALILGQQARQGFEDGAGHPVFDPVIGNLGRVPGTGIRRHAIGGFIRPGEGALVGDAGVEGIVGLQGGGAYVYTNSETRKMMAQPSRTATSGGGALVVRISMPVHVDVAGTSSSADEIAAAVDAATERGGERMVDALLDFQRRGGGSVTAILERG